MPIAVPYDEEVVVGTGPYAQPYRLRRRELVVRFADPDDLGTMSIVLAHPEWDMSLAVEHDSRRFAGFRAAGLRWIELGAVGDLRDQARAIAEQPGVVSATPVYGPTADEWECATPVPGDFLVRIVPDRESAVIAELDADLGLEHMAEASEALPDERHLFRLAAGPRDDGFDLVDEIRRRKGVIEVEHDWLQIETYHQGWTGGVPPGDERWDDQWSLRQIGMPKAWAATKGAPGVPVVVIDSGFDLAHPDLVLAASPDRLDVEALWRGSPLTEGVGPSEYPHGTPTAGIVGATIDNGGVASVAGECKVIPIRLGAAPSSGKVAAALGWARQHAVGDPRKRVVNMSLTTVATSSLVRAVDVAAAAGVVMCAATGNAPPDRGGPTVGFPARHRSVIGVGASDREDMRKTDASSDSERWQSRYGQGLDVVAPGVDIWTTDEVGEDAGYNRKDPNPLNTTSKPGEDILWYGVAKPAGDDSGDFVAVFGGTSGATPHVAGLAALLIAQHPALTLPQVRNIIEQTCVKPAAGGYAFTAHPEFVAGAATWNPEVGCGRIDAGAALEKAPALMLQPVPIPRPDADPCDPDDVVTIGGYIGRGPGDTWRVFATPALDRWVEVHEPDIVDVTPKGDGDEQWLHVRAGASLRHVAAVDMRATERILSRP